MEKLDQKEGLGRMAGFSPINLFQTYAVLSPCYTVKWHIRRSRNKAKFSLGNHLYLLHARYESTATSLKLQTDSMGGSDFGCGVYFVGYWHHQYWPDL